MRAGVPLYASAEVLERAGQTLSEDGEPLDEESADPQKLQTPASAEELEKLSAFREFVAGLDLDDLGAGESEAEGESPSR